MNPLHDAIMPDKNGHIAVPQGPGLGVEPDMAVVDRFVRHRPSRSEADEPPFTRFPTWMWRNREFEALTLWLRDFNEPR